MAHVRPSQNEFEVCEMVHVRKGTEANDLLIGTDEPDMIEGWPSKSARSPSSPTRAITLGSDTCRSSASEADRQSHLRDGERVTGPQRE